MYTNCAIWRDTYCEFCARVDVMSGEFGHNHIEFVSSAGTICTGERVSKISNSHRRKIVKKHGCPTAH